MKFTRNKYDYENKLIEKDGLNDINLNYFENDIQLDSDVNLMCDYDEEYISDDIFEIEIDENKEESVKHKSEDVAKYIETSHKGVEKAEKKKVEINKKEGKIMTLKEKLCKINEKNNRYKSNIEELLLTAATKENITCKSIQIPNEKVEFIMNYLKDNGLDVSTDKQIDNDTILIVKWE